MISDELGAFRKDESGFSPAFFLTERVRTVLSKHIDAIEANTRRFRCVTRICVFENSDSPLQAMLVSQPRGMDACPRFLSKPKLFMPLRGQLVLLRLEFSGNVLMRELLTPGRHVLSYIDVRLPYIDLPVNDFTTHLEITLGPHDRVSDRNCPPMPWNIGEQIRKRWCEEQIQTTLANESGFVP